MFGHTKLYFLSLLAVIGVWYARAAVPIQDPFLVLPPERASNDPLDPAPQELEFTLRHVYHRGTHKYPDVHRYVDVPTGTDFETENHGNNVQKHSLFKVKTVSLNMQRLKRRNKEEIDSLLQHAEIHGQSAVLPTDAWEVRRISGPNTTDKATVVSLAWMAANAYVPEPWTGDWKDVKGGFNFSGSFGWDMDGLRGHIFTDKTNSTVVIGLKGTSMAIFDGPETTGHDKTNDNLFASCCGGQGGPFVWKQVSDCMTSAYTCNSTCLVRSLRQKDRYYQAARDLYHNVTERYPNADIWLTGHSLGGVVSSLLGLTYSIPVMTFEAYPDALAASRLKLPVPPGYKAGSHSPRTDRGIYHYGHTADPVYMGLCNSAFSPCSIAGYAMESVCHTGKTCEYDTVEDLGWSVSINNHRILTVIPEVLEKYDTVPKCRSNPDCTDCFNWKFYKSNGTEKTTTSQSSTTAHTRTRTETCKTPGWWDCLDESTTTSHTSTTSTSTTSPTSTTTTTTTTTTCKTPGWFGCLDPITSTSTRTITTPRPDPSTTQTTSEPTTTSTHTTCTSKEFFGLICVDPSPSITTSTTTKTLSSTSTTSTSSAPPKNGGGCMEWYWFGWCKRWAGEGDEDMAVKMGL